MKKNLLNKRFGFTFVLKINFDVKCRSLNAGLSVYVCSVMMTSFRLALSFRESLRRFFSSSFFLRDKIFLIPTFEIKMSEKKSKGFYFIE